MDWSTVHEPTGELFAPIQNSAEWRSFRFTPEQVSQYWRDGYISNIPVLTPDQCDRILADYTYFLDEKKKHPQMALLYEYKRNQSDDPDNVLMHCLGHWRLTKLFHDLVFLPQVVVPASQLLVEGTENVAVRLWHDQLFAKPAKYGGVVAWHQDYSYWTRTEPMMHMTIHIALDEQTEDNGVIQYVPGSHRWNRNGGPLPVTDFNFKDMESIRRVLNEEELRNFKPVMKPLKKGEAVFHHCLSVHGSYSNRSDSPRRAAVLNYFADGVCSNTDEELLKGSRIPKGNKMEGQLYPLVFNPDWML
ncbi:hypothetical protein ScPMuIL_002489 [Solemya velum]